MTVCTVWELDLDCCDLPDGDHDDLIAAKQAISSQILFDGSGRRWGTCEVTVRPCLRRCGGIFGLPNPYKGSDGEWRNFATCGCAGACSCDELCEIVLDGPVAEVVQVLIDGDELMPENYRLDLVNGEYRLLRTDGGCWPSCSDIAAGCDEEGAFCVTYMKGIELDALAIAANSELTCELVKSCIDGCKTCRLPKNVQAVVRRGVAINFDTAKSWLKSLPMVAAFLEAVNPEGLSSPSTVWSPDLPESRITVVVEGS
jgi:hypothetical protein